MLMREQQSRPKEPIQDEWGTTTRIGYEDRPAYHAPRKAPPKRKGSPLLRAIGGLLTVGGIAWIAYVVTSTEGIGGLLRPGSGWPARPVILCAAGLLILLLEKLIR